MKLPGNWLTVEGASHGWGAFYLYGRNTVVIKILVNTLIIQPAQPCLVTLPEICYTWLTWI